MPPRPRIPLVCRQSPQSGSLTPGSTGPRPRQPDRLLPAKSSVRSGVSGARTAGASFDVRRALHLPGECVHAGSVGVTVGICFGLEGVDAPVPAHGRAPEDRSSRASCFGYSISLFRKPCGLPPTKVGLGFSAERRWPGPVDRERNKGNRNGNIQYACCPAAPPRAPRCRHDNAWRNRKDAGHPADLAHAGPHPTRVADSQRPRARRRRDKPGRSDQTLLAGVRPNRLGH